MLYVMQTMNAVDEPEPLLRKHPRLLGWLVALALPVGMILTVFGSTCAVILPIASLMGWH